LGSGEKMSILSIFKKKEDTGPYPAVCYRLSIHKEDQSGEIYLNSDPDKSIAWVGSFKNQEDMFLFLSDLLRSTKTNYVPYNRAVIVFEFM
jgi:hypothetical protein